MKKILCLLMMFCSLSVFAATNVDGAGSYYGTLDIAVDGTPSDPVTNQKVDVVINGDGMATLTIYDFWFGWIPCGDVAVTLKLNSDGTFSGPVNISVPLLGNVSATLNSGSIVGSSCTISLTAVLAGQTVSIDYMGNK